jgi:hypothetical protein
MVNESIMLQLYLAGILITFILIELHFIYRVRKFGFLYTVAEVMELPQVQPNPTNALALYVVYPAFFAMLWPGLVVMIVINYLLSLIPARYR